MTPMNVERDLHRERYALEFDRRGQINDRADAQVTLITIFGAIVGYYVLNFPAPSWSTRFVLFLLAFGVLCLGVLAAGFLVGRLIWRDTAIYLPNPRVEHDFCKEALKYHLNQDPVNGVVAAERFIEEELNKDFLEAADSNAKQNDARDHLIFLSKRWIFIAVIGFLLTAIAHLCVTRHAAGPPPVTCNCISGD